MKSIVTIIAAATVLVACGKAPETVPVTAPAPAASEAASQPAKS